MNNDIKAISELKILSIDIINRARSGSPGICLDMASVMYILFTKVLNVLPNNPNFINRDRVILSSAHITPLYYAMLYMAGYPIKKEDLMNYKRVDGIVPGIPEINTTPGIDASTGYAGDGIGIAVGQALAKRYLSNLIRQEDDRLKLLSYNVFCFASDADMMSGASYEAMSFAGAQKLDNLFILYDANGVGADGENDVNGENFIKLYQAIGFHVDIVRDNTNIREIVRVFDLALRAGKPCLLIFKNVIGADSFNAGKSILHSGPLSFDDTENIRKKYNVFLPPFEVSKDSLIHVQNQILARSKKIYPKWTDQYNKAKGRMSSVLNEILAMLDTGNVTIPFDSVNFKINDGYRESLIETNTKIMNLFAPKSALFLGGSAGIASTTRAVINASDYMSFKNPISRNIKFGVRERGMGNILNGMALNGLRVFGSTKLCYYDECKSAVRMTALMNLPVTYIFTHDSLYDSEDGPARIPCEQLISLRATPNLMVYRPADINEVMGCWEAILKNSKPAALVITKNNTPKLPGSSSKEVAKGAYIVKKEQSKLHGIIIATGSEVVSALQIAYDLANSGLDIRVVSMPCVELFKSMGEEYERELLPKNVKTIVMEAAQDYSWANYATNEKYILGINDFAYSGVTLEVLQKMNYDYDSLKLKVESLLR